MLNQRGGNIMEGGREIDKMEKKRWEDRRRLVGTLHPEGGKSEGQIARRKMRVTHEGRGSDVAFSSPHTSVSEGWHYAFTV